jgi:DNA-directed RNA polymerase specialized sigma24 family protein
MLLAPHALFDSIRCDMKSHNLVEFRTAPVPMKNEWNLSQESFDQLLSWLDQNRESAGKRYEEIRRRLIKIFMCRGCTCPEDLADETINRVARKLPEIMNGYVGDSALYFLGVANRVCQEHFRAKPLLELPLQSDSSQDKELLDNCLEECLKHLTPANRDLVLEYYQNEGQAKIDHRKELAQRFGIGVNALRIQVCRIRTKLQKCMSDCSQQRPANK